MAFAISQTAQPRLALPQGTTTAPPAGATTTINPRTRLLLEGPIAATLLRLAPPNLVVNVILLAVTASIDAHFVGRPGRARACRRVAGVSPHDVDAADRQFEHGQRDRTVALPRTRRRR